MRPTPAEEKFWSYVKGDLALDKCWEWTGDLRKGYGFFKHTVNGVQKKFSAHRFSFELHNGPLERKWCLHSCDNPCCVNPSHLFKGTAKENTLDSLSKGRRTQNGINNKSRKLSPEKVRAIRVYAYNRWTQEKIAKHFCVSHSLIGQILRGTEWAHVR